MRVGVVGGGAIGLCCALALRRAGAEVVVVERGEVGSGASCGNAGWITPGFSAPLAAPGAVRAALGWMVDPRGPFRLKPRLDPLFVSWCWQFWRSSSASRYAAGMRALLALNARTFELFDELRASGVEFELHSRGVIFAALTAEGLRAERTVLGELEAIGYPGTIVQLDGPALRELEPSLTREIAGGLHAPSERHVRPESLTSGLASTLRVEGVEILEHSSVTALRPAGPRWRIVGDGDEIAVDRVVVAAGAWTGRLLRTAGVRLPLEAAKGYSITTSGGPAINSALYLVEAKIACSPFGGPVRFAGMLDLCGLDTSIPARRVATLREAVARYLPESPLGEGRAAWAGLRPLAPDGLPVIGALPGREGLFVATGHGMLGITLAPATAEALAPVVLGQPPDVGLAPFAPGRFGPR